MTTHVKAFSGAFALALIPFISAKAAVTYVDGEDWIGGGSDTLYSTSANWQNGRDSASTGAMRFNGQAGKTVTFDAAYSTLASYVWVGEYGDDSAADYNLYVSSDGATVNPLTFTASDSTYGFTAKENLSLADGASQTGALTVDSGSYSAANGYWGWGAGAKLVVNIAGGAVAYTGDIYMMWGGNVTNIVNVKSGSLSAKGKILAGTNSADSKTTVNVGDPDGAGTTAALTCGTLELGEYGCSGMTSIVNLNAGGTLTTASVAQGTGVAGDPSLVLAFNGGTLKAAAAGTLIGSGLTVTVDETNGGTINTDGKAITVSSAIEGSGTLTLTGGGSVTFTVNPTCGISIDSESAPEVTYPEVNPYPDGAYFWIGAANGDWNDGSNWSLTQGGAAANAYPNDVTSSVAVFPAAASVTVGSAAKANYIICDAAVTIKGTEELQCYYIVGDGVVTLDGAHIRTPAIDYKYYQNTIISNDLVVANDVKLTLSSSTRLYGGYMALLGDLSGSGNITIANSSVNDSKGEYVQLAGDNSGFTGTYTYSRSKGSRGNNTYANKFLSSTAGSASATWSIFYAGEESTSDGLFSFSDGTIEFGALNTRMPAYTSTTYNNNTIKVGALGQADSMAGSWGVSTGNTIHKVGSGTLNCAVANTATLAIGGGDVVLTSDGVPDAISFKGDGGYIDLTDDATLNASIADAISSVDEGSFAGLSYSGESEMSVSFETAISALAGKNLVKKGSGTLYLTAVSAQTMGDVTVSEGTLVLEHGAKVGNVTVADGASLLIDIASAENGEEVFTYTSISGSVACRNKSDRATLNDSASPWTVTISGGSVEFTWCGYQDNNWATSGNWMIGEEVTTDVPTANDTAVFNGDATLESASAIQTPVTVTAGILTLTPGMTFSSLSVEDGAKIAFNSNIAAVGGTLDLITVNGGTFTADDCTIPSNYTYTLTDGVLVATRAQSTYTWAPQGEDTGWSTSGNWTVDGSAVAETPVAADIVIFPASEEDGFTAWTVTLTEDVYATQVTLNGNVALTGARTLKAPLIDGSAELQLNGAHIGANGADMVVNCPINVRAGTVDYIYLGGYNMILNAKLTGSGTLISDSSETSQTGVTFNADVSGFTGEFQAINENGRGATRMYEPAIGSSNAVWRIYTHAGTGSNHGEQEREFILHSNETLYAFGAYVGCFWAGKVATPHLEIGNRSDVASSFSLFSYGSRGRYVITKVGSGEMTITNTKGDSQIGTLYPNGGTTIIKTTPGAITFNGDGMIKTPAYDVTENEVTSSYYPDVSGKITGSTGPIAFTNDEGEEHTWAALDSTSNTGGLSKYGSGKLTITTKMGYEGITSVFDDGVLEIDTALNKTFDADYPVNALSTGTITGAAVTAYAYPAGTTLYGTETADDYLKVLNNNSSEALVADLDFSGVTTVDVSAQDLYDEENNKLKNFVLARTTGAITGIGKVGNGLTLIVPDCPDGVAEGKWVWTVRTTVETVDNVTYHCVTVTPKALPFVISIQ